MISKKILWVSLLGLACFWPYTGTWAGDSAKETVKDAVKDNRNNALPYMPSFGARHALTMLADEAGLDMGITYWPQPANAVQQALDKLTKPLSPALQKARALVQAELNASLYGKATFAVRNRVEEFVGFGDDYTPGSLVEMETPAWLAGQDGQSADLNANSWHFSGRLGARIEQNADPVLAHASGLGSNSSVQPRLTGSALVATLGPVNLQAFSHNTWWGPGWQSALMASNNVPAWNAIGFQRAESGTSESALLSWMGPWSFEFFVAKAQDPMVVSNQPSGYFYTDMRVNIKPYPWLEMAASRMFQNDGVGRIGGLNNYLKGIIGKKSDFNVYTDKLAPGQKNPDVGNSLAGYDVRASCEVLGLRCAAYYQLMGEDTHTNNLPSKFLGVYGTETWSEDGRFRLFYEYANTFCYGHPFPVRVNQPGCAYVNYQYPQGETNGTRWQGSSFGPDSALNTLGFYDAENRLLVKYTHGQIGNQVGSYHPSDSNLPRGVTRAFSAKQSFDWLGTTWTPELDYLHLASGIGMRAYRNTDLRLGLTATMPLDGPWLNGPWDSAPYGLFSKATRSLNSPSLWQDVKGTTERIFSADVWPGWAWAAGGVMLAHTLDSRGDHWAQNHQSKTDKMWGRWGSDVPLLTMAGTGLMASGFFGESLNQPASLAFQSGLLVFVGDEALKFAVGRDRPNLNQGDATFAPFKTTSLNSSFASAHTAIAFATLTPYAQAYDMPWLYAVGAFTGLGRMQQRQHWFSDTVAGAALGYATASALTYQRERQARYGEAKPGEPTFLVSPSRVDVAWAFH